MVDPLVEIRVMMTRMNWKPSDIGRLLGVGKVQTHNILSGRTELKWKHMVAICEAANTDINLIPKK